MLTEKYRPKTFMEFRGHEKIVKAIQNHIKKNKTIPHLLFYGNAGTGKTTLALIIARTLFGSDWRGNFLELNASADRGIGVIRNRVKEFARTKALAQGNTKKIIFLDEADFLTKEAMTALRRTMEEYHRGCRFILSVNYKEKLIEPLVSRCLECHFKDFKAKEMVVHLLKIMKKETGDYDKKIGIRIAKRSGGDMRKAISMLNKYLDGGGISGADLEDNLLGMKIGAFIKYTFEHAGEADLVLDKIYKEVIKQKKRKDMLPLVAEANFNMTQGTIKVLQLQSLFCGLKGLMK